MGVYASSCVRLEVFYLTVLGITAVEKVCVEAELSV